MTIALWVHIFTLATDYCIMGTYFFLGETYVLHQKRHLGILHKMYIVLQQFSVGCIGLIVTHSIQK
jgi:hypothetical protein